MGCYTHHHLQVVFIPITLPLLILVLGIDGYTSSKIRVMPSMHSNCSKPIWKHNFKPKSRSSTLTLEVNFDISLGCFKSKPCAQTHLPPHIPSKWNCRTKTSINSENMTYFTGSCFLAHYILGSQLHHCNLSDK